MTFDSYDEVDRINNKTSKWIRVKEKPCDLKKCLAIHRSEKGKIYDCMARGWFSDTIYSCRTDEENFIIESHGPKLPATHWMPLPELPKD